MGKARRRKPGNATRRAWAKPYSLKSGITGPNRTILGEYKARAAGLVRANDGFDSQLKSLRFRFGEMVFERHLRVNPATADRYIRNLCTLVGDWDADRFVVLSDGIFGRDCLYWNGPRAWIVHVTSEWIYKSVVYRSLSFAKWIYNNDGVIWKEKIKHVDLMQEVREARYPEPTIKE